jgi:hypothetical protein
LYGTMFAVLHRGRRQRRPEMGVVHPAGRAARGLPLPDIGIGLPPCNAARGRSWWAARSRPAAVRDGMSARPPA